MSKKLVLIVLSGFYVFASSANDDIFTNSASNNDHPLQFPLYPIDLPREADEESFWRVDKEPNRYPLASEQDLPRAQEILFNVGFRLYRSDKYKACKAIYRPIVNSFSWILDDFGKSNREIHSPPLNNNRKLQAVNCITPVTCHCRENKYFRIRNKSYYKEKTNRKYLYACVEPPSAQVESEADYSSAFSLVSYEGDDSTWLKLRKKLLNKKAKQFIPNMEGIVKFALPQSACPKPQKINRP